MGARLELKTNLRTFVAEMSTQAPTHAMEAPIVRFALPAGTEAPTLRIRWPSGYEQLVSGLATGQVHLVKEPPLLTLSKRRAGMGDSVVVSAQAYSETGDALTASAGVSIELDAGAQGKWTGGLECSTSGACERTWLATGPAGGTDTVVVKISGKALRIRPKIRY